jgi:hypothetical protein
MANYTPDRAAGSIPGEIYAAVCGKITVWNICIKLRKNGYKKRRMKARSTILTAAEPRRSTCPGSDRGRLLFSSSVRVTPAFRLSQRKREGAQKGTKQNTTGTKNRFGNPLLVLFVSLFVLLVLLPSFVGAKPCPTVSSHTVPGFGALSYHEAR